MGNAPSSGGAEPPPADGGEHDNSGGMFRLPLYRGGRDVFLPLDDDDDDDDEDCGGFQQEKIQLGGPPLLSVEPKLGGGAGDSISPLHGSSSGKGGEANPLFSPVSLAAERPVEYSPPSVISSSESSYVSCYEGSTTSSQGQKNNLLPVPLPRPAPGRKGSKLGENGIFDCVKKPASMQQPKPLTKKYSSSGSLSSLFETCMRPDDDENEYEEDCSEQGSYYSRRNYVRSSSVASQGSYSNYSNCSHNSYHLTCATSRTSLASAFSAASPISEYTEEERNMVDGDEPSYDSDLRRVRNYHVVTTAALPWMTGTAVNPLLRAAYLVRRNGELRQQQTREPTEDERPAKSGMDASADGEQSLGGDSATSRCDGAGAPLPQHGPEMASSPKDGSERAPLGHQESLRMNLIEPPGTNGPASPAENGPSSTPCNDDADDCSLDYSCFSFSEVDAPPPAREAVSPLGEEDDSLSLSPFTPLPEENVPAKNATVGAREEETRGTVTLVLPWLEDAADRQMLYGSSAHFAHKGEQEEYIRSWLAGEAGMPAEATELNIAFYPARYHKKYNSIFALGDICDLLPDHAADVCILEEPEHLNWYRAPGCAPWSSKFRHCVGVIHTNYKAYARDHARAGFLAAPLLAGVNSLVVQANCHRVVKLSGVLQEFASSECVENVHGIREAYLEEGRRRRTSMAVEGTTEKGRAYFIGKLLWAKGFDQLLELQASFRERTGDHFEIDIYGSGPDESEIKRAFHGNQGEEGGILHSLKWGSAGRRGRLPANFMGRLDHSELAGDEYSIFVNPSLTEVLCTTTAEAIAMGKWAIVPSHPSNAFFTQFPNCLPYRNRREFTSKLKHALNNDPPHLTEELASVLSWEAATMRCVSAAAISRRDAARSERMLRAKEEKTLTRKISGLWNGSKSDIKAMDVSQNTSSVSLEPMGYGSIPLITP